MLTQPTADQVRTLAPDAAAARAGEQLAGPKRWSETGRTESAAWGLCQGSGASPYQVSVDLSGPAYRCSCPSRKIPCKHTLGLLFVLAGGEIPAAPPPDWVEAWLESRASRATAASRSDRPAESDPAARAKRVESRERKVAAGIDELDRWLGDLVRRGLDGARSDGYRFWDAMGARLVDAQAGGLGRSVRALGSAANSGDAWPHLLLAGIARLYLLCEAYRRIDELPAPLRADVRSLVGWTTKEEELDPAQDVEDRWLVIGRRVDEGVQVMTGRTWLLGETTQRLALHLAFGVGAAPPTVLAWPGQAFRATLSFYPSATPLRAVVRPILVPDGDVIHVPGATSIAELLANHTERLALNPFIDAWPVVLGDVVPVMRGEALLLRHPDGVALPVAPASTAPQLLAVAGGRPLTLVGEWDGYVVRPLAALVDGRLVALDPPEVTALPIRDAAPSWPMLMSAALVGTERSGALAIDPDDLGGIIGRSAIENNEGRLLATAGILAIRRRAGRRSGVDAADLPEPAAIDPRPALAGAPARLLASVIEEDRALLDECLGLIRSSGRRLPDERLPDLLAAAATDAGLRERVADLGGPRAAWLSRMVPELRDGSVPDVTIDARDGWDAASGAKQRGLVVRAIRRSDPAAARVLMEKRFDDLAGDERAEVLQALEESLSAADEAFLDAALGDRRADVRRVAADLLVRLDGSAFARRLFDRARPLLSGKGKLRPGLLVTLPTPDEELEAVGLAGKPPVGIGERAWLLRQILGHVPPARWTDWLRADPGALLDRALRTDEARPILEGWMEATGRFGDAGWAVAILAESRIPEAVPGIDLVRVLEGLSRSDAARVVAGAARQVDLVTLARLAERCRAPWPAHLVDAVFSVIRAAGADTPEYAVYALVRRAAATVPPERADDLETLASHDGEVRPALAGAIETIQFRRQMHAAFAELRPI